MLSVVHAAALKGIDAIPIDIEVDVLSGLPKYTVVGLTDKSIQESRERLTAALSNLGFNPPRRKTIVSLAPASLKKEGSLYDLPIALGFLCASQQLKINPQALENTWFIGELGLDGAMRPIAGVLPIVLSAIKHHVKEIFIPYANRDEAAPLSQKINIYPVKSFADVIGYLNNGQQKTLKPLIFSPIASRWEEPEIDLADIKGQEHAKRALMIAAAGQHNILMVGPPGTGKTLLARALAGILPPLTQEESFMVTSLYSIAGELPAGESLIKQRPFRHPHYGASAVAMIGGGAIPKPGEVSLAHTGVLFLDELPEFPRSVLDQLRQPLEDGTVVVARAAQTIKYPAKSMLVGAMNPCPCGFIGSTKRDCRCAPGDIIRYQRRVSGPLLDRFDLHVAVTDISLNDILDPAARTSTTSQTVAKQINHIRNRQQERQNKPNAYLNNKEIKEYCAIDQISRRLLTQASEKFHLSARGVHRLLKVALTIADFAGEEKIHPAHIAEALQYREQLQQYLPDFV
ncbi:MAG: YifB family Mg chelatase-like AAA ATPase [bacterium]|nr:YifB family Mg chelatase-like AAA ATPase [bacterium]